jgi:hypothetical protein
LKGAIEKCFVIMPFSKTTEGHTESYWTSYYESFLKPLIEENVNFPVERSRALRTDIVKDIIRDLIFSRLVIADITDFNANVLWELGVRQSFRNGTIVIAEKGTKIPFDFSHNAVLQYPPIGGDSGDSLEMPKFRGDFKAALEDCCDNPGKYDSPVLETLSGRGTIFEIISIEDNIQKIDAVLTELDYNKHVSIQIFETLKGDPGLSSKLSVPTMRFSTCAVELLITHRYLKADASFYIQMINYFSVLISMNSQINSWQYNYINVRRWFLNETEKGITMLKKTEELLNQARERLDNSI